MATYDLFSLREIGGQDRLEEFTVHETVQTASGKTLEVILVCDGLGGGGAGEQAARLTSRAIIDALEISESDAVPAMLVTAVEEANRIVYSEMRGTGSSTAAVVAVDTTDGEYGRAFIASVGDSRIYLVRRREMVRLNIDHTLGNEYIYAEQMSANDAARMENADYPTRIVGIGPEIQVDIGFYVERGNPFVNARRAFEIGKRGMLLQEGDTLYVGSKGVFEVINEESGQRPLEDEDFIDFAMDDSAEHAGRALLDMATRRNPPSNLSLAILFVESRFRNTVRIGPRLSRRAQVLIAMAIVAFVAGVSFGILSFVRIEQQNRIQNQTRSAFEEVIARASWTATFTPSQTNTPTNTPTPTPTIRPTAVSENQVALQYFVGAERPPQPIFAERRVAADEPSLLIVTGPNADNLPADFDPSSIYMYPNSAVEFTLVRNNAPTSIGRDGVDGFRMMSGGRSPLDIFGLDAAPNLQAGTEFMDLQMGAESDVYIRSGDFSGGGIRASIQGYPDISLFALTGALSANQIPPDPEDPTDTEKIAFTCYGDNTSSACSFTLEGGSVTAINVGERALIDLDESQLLIVEDPDYEEVKGYRDLVFSLTGNDENARDLWPYLDIDGDTVRYPFDECEFEPGNPATAGCPDTDGDGIRDTQDDCPNEPGPLENGGCPFATATPLNLDPDGDGILPPEDACPTEAGPVENNGCPLTDAEAEELGITVEPTTETTATPVPTAVPAVATPTPIPAEEDPAAYGDTLP